MRRVVAAAAALVAAGVLLSTPLSGKSRLGLTDGADWVRLADAAKYNYIGGIQDAVVGALLLFDESAVAKIARHFPIAMDSDGVRFLAGTSDVVESLDRFYEEPANRVIEVWFALEVVTIKYRGGSAGCQEDVTLYWRRWAQRLSVNDLAHRRDICLDAGKR